GGETAAFLRAEHADGDALIDSLVRDQPVVERPRARAVETAIETGPAPVRDEVLAKLVSGDTAPAKAPRAREAAPAPEAPKDVDASVIDSLLADRDKPPGRTSGGPGNPGKDRS